MFDPTGNTNEKFNSLTEREREILLLFAQGKTSAAVAEELFISKLTVGCHANNILAKLQVHSRIQALVITGLMPSQQSEEKNV